MNEVINLWDDNPTLTDLLGIDPVVDAVMTAIKSPSLDPVTISIQSPWGGGKSSALNMIEDRFADDEAVLVLRADPWEFEDVDDVRGTLISQILGGLQGRLGESFTTRIGGLLKRISWTRVANTVVRSAITMTVDPDKLVDAFTLKPEEAKTMAGFRQEFSDLMADSHSLECVVVLVDDLDRCKPSTVMSTLEAIKVFLSVPKMAFVLAAEEEMIRWSIAQDAHAGGRSEFADRYLEKIVQLPVTLPRLTRDNTETYVALLLAERRGSEDRDSFDKLVAHVSRRREERKSPHIGGEYELGVQVPDPADLQLASLLARGLDADKWKSPRAIKRFLNAWGVRDSIASARGIEIRADISLKLYILEQRFTRDFNALLEVPDAERFEFVTQWEKWGRGEQGSERPAAVSEETKEWAGSEPSLAAAANEFDRYVNLAAAFTSFSAGAGLSDQELQILADLSHESDVLRNEAVKNVVESDPSTRDAVLDMLLVRIASFEHRDKAIESACAIAKSDPALVDRFAQGIQSYGFKNLEMGDALEIANAFPSQVGIAMEIANSSDVDQFIRKAVAEQLSKMN